MDRYELIRRAHIVNRKNMNELAREYHHSKRTIRKILDHIRLPGYRRQKAVPLPRLGPVKDWIDNILESDRKSPRKQRHTALRIYTRLVLEKDYQGCESGIRQHVRRWKQSRTEAESFVRLSYEPGMDAQADYGEAQVVMNGKPETVHVLSLRMCYSTKSVQQCFPGETRECVFEGLRRISEELGGLWLDNFPAAVSRVLSGRNRIETVDFIGFRSHYLFNAMFCAPGKGNEKGHAETLVGYGRRNFMVPIPEVSSYEELNSRLLKECRADEDRKIRG
ncbi:IS21 family transposase [bacterium]|nr:IS21 family transposase [candidate division CSSED10-310 bacterium]